MYSWWVTSFTYATLIECTQSYNRTLIWFLNKWSFISNPGQRFSIHDLLLRSCLELSPSLQEHSLQLTSHHHDWVWEWQQSWLCLMLTYLESNTVRISPALKLMSPGSAAVKVPIACTSIIACMHTMHHHACVDILLKHTDIHMYIHACMHKNTLRSLYLAQYHYR